MVPTLTFLKEDNQLRVETKSADIPEPTALQANRLLKMEKNCKSVLTDSMAKIHAELGQRRKEENNIRTWRGIDKTDKEKMEELADRENSILERSVYDVARERANEEVHRKGDPVEEQEEKTEDTKIDILAPYLVDYQGKTLDALQAEFVMKKCKNDFRKRLMDRAQIIQKRLEEEQDQLKKRRAQMQRRGDNVEKDEKAFEQYQSNAMFRIQILEQRLSRHEVQAIKKFAELERTLAEDVRLSAVGQKKDKK